MTNWARKYLLHISDVCRDCANDNAIGESARQAFANARTFSTNEYRDRADALEKAFSVMCSACSAARLHECSGSPVGFHYCKLLTQRLH